MTKARRHETVTRVTNRENAAVQPVPGDMVVEHGAVLGVYVADEELDDAPATLRSTELPTEPCNELPEAHPVACEDPCDWPEGDLADLGVVS